MSKAISFEGIGDVTATFLAADGVRAGSVVALTEGGTVGPCAAGQRFCGVALAAPAGGAAAVQVRGFVTVAVSGSGLTTGWAELTADGGGGVKAPASGETGGRYLVADRDGDTAVILL